MEKVLINGINYELDPSNQTASVCQLDNDEKYEGDIVIPYSVSHNGMLYSVVDIRAYAFCGCRRLTSISIPNSITCIGNGAFYYCSGLISIAIPESVTSINGSAFCSCTGLTSIVIPNSITYIGGCILSDCTSLTSVIVAKMNPKYDSRSDCNAIIETATNTLIAGCQNTIIPNSVTSIGAYAFYGCRGITMIDIPTNVTSIGDYAFSDCTGLTSVVIPNSITSIGNDAFSNCLGLNSIAIPNSVMNVGEWVFSNCTNITSITVGNQNPKYDSRSNCNAIIETKSNTLIAGCSMTVIPENVVCIGKGAFAGCINLTSISIPNSVIEIGECAFLDCENLAIIDGLSNIQNVQWCAFENTLWFNALPDGIVYINNTLYTYKGEMSQNMSIIIKDGIVNITDNAFEDCKNLTSISIPESVINIGDAFIGCTGLTHITIPQNVATIGRDIFRGCLSLNSVIWNVRCCTYDDSPFSTIAGQITSFIFGANVESIPRNLCKDMHRLISIEFPHGLKSIYSCAFSNCIGLKSVVIPNTVTYLNGFSDCNQLTKVIIPESVTSIGYKAFSNCANLSSVTIPNSVIWIGKWAFYGCKKIKSIIIPECTIKIDRSAFEECANLSSITLLSGITKLGYKAFSCCVNLTSISFPNDITIGMRSFYKCTNLSTITLYGSAHIAEGAFRWCHLQTIFVPQGMTDAFCEMGLEPWRDKIVESRQKEQRAARQTQLAQRAAAQKQQKTILFFDTETNGLPANYKLGVTATDNWPRLIQLGWIITDESGNILKRKSQLIYPQSFTIDADVTRLTGITTAEAQRNGIALSDVLSEFMADVESASLLVGHNVDFDMHIMGCELYRMGMNYRVLIDKPSVCTMVRSTNFCALPSTSRYYSGYKFPSLTELYTKLFGHAFSGAHDALSDITATKDCYFELRRRGIV